MLSYSRIFFFSAVTLSKELEKLIASSRKFVSAPGCPKQDVVEPLPRLFWSEVEKLCILAHALKETDTMISFFKMMVQPGSGHCPPPEVWVTAAQYLLGFSDIESHSVLNYPGTCESAAAVNDVEQSSITSSHSFDFSRNCLKGGGGYLHPSRETLLLMGGTVPHASRFPRATGFAVSDFLKMFTQYLEGYLPLFSSGDPDGREAWKVILPCMGDVLRVVITVVGMNKYTIRLSLVADPIVSLLKLFFELSFKSVEGEEEMKKQTEVISKFISAIIRIPMHGPRLALHFFSQLGAEQWIGLNVLEKLSERSDSFMSVVFAVFVENLKQTLISLKALSHQESADFSALLRRIEAHLEAVFTYNAKNDNPLELQQEKEAEIRLLMLETLIVAMRREAPSPDTFLREAMKLMERHPSSMAIEAELLTAKAQLLEAFELDEEGKATVYTDLLESLRNLVEMRPRGYASGESDSAAGGLVDSSLSDLLNSSQVMLDDATQSIMQRAHGEVISVFSSSQEEKFLNEAYGIIISHKYHGLAITKELIKPLLSAFARNGDGRVFNLVDLCVLYSNNTVDLEVLASLFETCAKNGDYYRARALLQLLEETVPGFLIKAGEEIHEPLKALGILPRDSRHLFLLEDDIKINEALGRTYTPMRELPG